MPIPPKGSSSAFSSGGGSTQKESGVDTRKVIKVLYWLTVLAGLVFAYMNIAPYARIAKTIILSTADIDLVKLISYIPVINGIAATIGTAVHWVIGFVLWAVIQTVEVFPIVLQRDRAFMKTIINEANADQKFEVKETDDPALAALKKWYNQFPSLTISRARTSALFVYAIDFMICITVYPPCPGGFGQLVYILFTGQFSRLDWTNIVLLLCTLFVIELIVRFLFYLGQIAYFMKSARSRS